MPPREHHDAVKSMDPIEPTQPLEWALPPQAEVITARETLGRKQRYEPAHSPPRAHESKDIIGPTVRFRSDSTRPIQSSSSKVVGDIIADTSSGSAAPIKDEPADHKAMTRRDELVDAFFDAGESGGFQEDILDPPPASDREGAATVAAELWSPHQERRRRRASAAVIVVVAAGISLLGAGLALRSTKSNVAIPVTLHPDAGVAVPASAASAALDVPLISPPPAPTASIEASAQSDRETSKTRASNEASASVGGSNRVRVFPQRQCSEGFDNIRRTFVAEVTIIQH